MANPRTKLVKKKQEFVSTFFTFVGIWVMLIIINIFVTGGYFWAKFPIFGMMIPLVIMLFEILGLSASARIADKEVAREEEALELEELEREELRIEQRRGWSKDDLV